MADSMALVERGNDPISAEAAASVLQWWSDAGVDVMVDEAPRDWLRPKAKAPTAVPGAPAAPAEEQLPGQLDLFQGYLRDSTALPSPLPARGGCARPATPKPG